MVGERKLAEEALRTLPTTSGLGVGLSHRSRPPGQDVADSKGVTKVSPRMPP